MKTPLWSLVLLVLACLFAPGRSGDCQGECLACGLQQPQLEQAFNTLVCLLECEGHVSSSLTWELCKRAVKLPQYPLPLEGGTLSKRIGEELEFTPLDLDSDSELLDSVAVAHYQEGPLEQHSAQYDSSPLGSAEEAEGPEGLHVELEGGTREEREATRDSLGEEGESEDEEDSRAVDLSKRFGGFLRGRHGYRKLIGAAPRRPLQKRYGGFIGIRKSARKWNNQKRVNQLLRQYLGMRLNRSGRFSSVPAMGVRRQNRL